MEYIVSRPERIGSRAVHESERKYPARAFPEVTDLDSLGTAVESYGRGVQPEGGRQPDERTVTAVPAGDGSSKAR
jgi:hypothetical protein